MRPAMSAVVTAIATLALLAGPAPAAAQFDPAELPYDRYLRAYGDVGAGIAVVKDGRVAVARGQGLRRIDAPGRWNRHTIFNVASVSKHMTAVALGTLVDRGVLGWDDPVRRFVPEFRHPDPALSDVVTIRDLLLHRSGVDGPNTTYLRASSADREEHTELLGNAEPGEDEPFRGPASNYNTSQYVTLGLVVERASGVRFETYLRRTLFAPLGMTRTRSGGSLYARDANRATPHVPLKRVRGTSLRFAAPLSRGAVMTPIGDYGTRTFARGIYEPAGGVYTTAADLSTWLRTLLAGGVGPNGHRVVRAETLAEILRPQIGNDDDWPLADAIGDEEQQAALGFDVQRYRGLTVISHEGNVPGRFAELVLVPELGLGIAVGVSTESDYTYLPYSVIYDVIDGYLGREVGATRALVAELGREAKELDTAAQARSERRRARPSLRLRRYARRYASDRGLYDDARIRLVDGRLRLRLGGYEAVLVPWGRDRFLLRSSYAEWGAYPSYAEFTVKRGAVAALSLDGEAFSPAR